MPLLPVCEVQLVVVVASSSVSLLIFCLVVLSTTESGITKFPTMVIELYVVLFNFVRFLVVCQVHKCLSLLYLLAVSTQGPPYSRELYLLEQFSEGKKRSPHASQMGKGKGTILKFYR